MKRSPLIWLSGLVFVAGLGVMLYPAVSSLVNARRQSQVVQSYQQEVSQESPEDIQRELERARAYNEKLKNSTVVMSDPFDADAVKITSGEYEQSLRMDDTGLMALIEIPEIGVRLPIYHGTGEEVLAKAVGHLQGTSLPVGGEDTHAVLSAHTALAQAKLFSDLDQLEPGDQFMLTTLNEVLTYEVYQVEVVEPADVSSLKIQRGRDLCTLVTCTPYGVNSHRLLVHGQRIPTPEKEMAATQRSPIDSMTVSWEYLAIGGGLLLAVVVLVVVSWLGKRSGGENR